MKLAREQAIMRIDRLLFYLRFAKTRSKAQQWISKGHIRCNGARVQKQDLQIGVGDVLTLPLPRIVEVIEIVSLPTRRGPASEARACYRSLDADTAMAIAGSDAPNKGRTAQQ